MVLEPPSDHRVSKVAYFPTTAVSNVKGTVTLDPGSIVWPTTGKPGEVKVVPITEFEPERVRLW